MKPLTGVMVLTELRMKDYLSITRTDSVSIWHMDSLNGGGKSVFGLK